MHDTQIMDSPPTDIIMEFGILTVSEEISEVFHYAINHHEKL